MKLYVTDVSPNSRRVLAAVEHLGLQRETEIRKFNLTAGEHRTDAFRAINPNQKVPALVDGDYKLWEANVIVLYLADRQGAESFAPSDLLGRTEILRWQSWEVHHFNRAIGGITWETIAKQIFNAGAPDAEKIKTEQENFRRFAAVLEDHLGDRPFILGDTVTAADFAVASHSALVLHPKSQVPHDAFPKVQAYLRRMEALPAWAATASQAPAEAAE